MSGFLFSGWLLPALTEFSGSIVVNMKKVRVLTLSYEIGFIFPFQIVLCFLDLSLDLL